MHGLQRRLQILRVHKQFQEIGRSLPLRSERGVSILELALILPVALILIAGLIDIGIKINRVKTVATAARHAARIAASHSKSLSSIAACGDPISLACAAADNPVQSSSTTGTGVPHDAACNFLRSANYNSEDWRVIVQRPTDIGAVEDGFGESVDANRKFYLVSVQVERLENKCLVCYDQIFKMLYPRSSSSFVLEGMCV